MRVFITGATGFIGSALAGELIGAGHKVLGLARSEAGAQRLRSAGAEVLRGDLEDLPVLRSGAAAADAVVHAAFNHSDLSNFARSCAIDRQAIETLGQALAGSGRRLLVSSGVGFAAGRPATEDDPPFPTTDRYPRASEATAAALRAQGVDAVVVRLPQVHDTTRQGLVSMLVQVAREKGVSAYIGEGRNRWAAAHRLDVAHLYRLALEREAPGGNHTSNGRYVRYQAVAEEGVALRDIAGAIGRRLGIPVVSKPPEEAAAHFGFVGSFVGVDLTGSSVRTRAELGWKPTRPGLLADLDALELTEPASAQG